MHNDCRLIGDILAGYDDQTMIHLTPAAESAFQSTGVRAHTSWVQLGEVREFTIDDYQEEVVGPFVAASPGASVRGFVVSPYHTSVFYPAWEVNWAAIPEYLNRRVLILGLDIQYVPI